MAAQRGPAPPSDLPQRSTSFITRSPVEPTSSYLPVASDDRFIASIPSPGKTHPVTRLFSVPSRPPPSSVVSSHPRSLAVLFTLTTYIPHDRITNIPVTVSPRDSPISVCRLTTLSFHFLPACPDSFSSLPVGQRHSIPPAILFLRCACARKGRTAVTGICLTSPHHSLTG